MLQKFIIKPGERYQTKITIQTRKGNDIDNIQEYDLTPSCLHQVEKFNKEYEGRSVTFVNEASPIYNCHGLTFGARRAIIWDPQEVAKILREDDYVMIADVKNVREGDIIVYYGDYGDISHSGLVIGNSSGVPSILSKWGVGREAVHRWNDCPYFKTCPTVKYFRISK
jgi:hypothetical protein